MARRVVCAICRRSRLQSQLQEERLVCADRTSCFKAAAVRMESPSAAQSEAKRLRREQQERL